jgi:hypothetical protein
MSLIPSESYSFPDHFTRTVVPLGKPKNEQSGPAPLERGRKRPAIVPLPNPPARPAAAIRPENSEPVRSKMPAPVPNPALRRVSAPPRRIPEAPARKIQLPPTLKPKIRWNARAPAMDPAQIGDNYPQRIPYAAPAPPAENVIPMKPTQVARPRIMSPPQPRVVWNSAPPVKTATPLHENPRATAVPNPQAAFFEMLQAAETALPKRRRKMKFRRFIVCESAALAILLSLVIVGLLAPPTNISLGWILDILTIASAVAAALIPILFYVVTPTLPEIER